MRLFHVVELRLERANIYNKEKKIKKIGFFLLTILICILLFVSLIVICSILSSLFEPKETIFWVAGDKTNLIFIFEIAIIVYAAPHIYGLKNIESRCAEVKKYAEKHWLKILLIYIAFVYMIVTDTTYITENKILHMKFLNPAGTEYRYNDVAGVDTGFYGKNNFWKHSKGSYYYYIRLKDGTRINLVNSGKVNEDKIPSYETYKEIEEFDNKIMSVGADKISSSDYIELSSLAEKYKVRISKIINNK